MGTQHLELDTVKEEESVGGVIKLTSIITLDTPDGATKLIGQIREEVRGVVKVLDLWCSRKVHE
jgi:hypothetical protein